MKYYHKVLLPILFFLSSFLVFGQSIKKMDFRNQSIRDILMALADMGGQSIIIDESVTGNATFFSVIPNLKKLCSALPIPVIYMLKIEIMRIMFRECLSI